MPARLKFLLRSILGLVSSLPLLALAYSETAALVVHGGDSPYLGGPISNPDLYHGSNAPHALPVVVQDSAVLPSLFLPGVSYRHGSAVTFSNQPQPSIAANSRFEGIDYGTDTSTYATADLRYAFRVSGTPGALVPLTIASFFELSTNRPTAHVNLAFAEVAVALTVDNPAAAFTALYGSNSSFLAMRCSTSYTDTSCLNTAGDDALVKTLDGAAIPSTNQVLSFDAVGPLNLRSGLMAFAFFLPMDASGSADVSIKLSATTAAYNGLFDFLPGPVFQGSLHEADAYIDPTISIDPTFLSLHPETVLTIESGLGNEPTASVPELPPGGLPLGGLAAVAAGLKRRAAIRAAAEAG